MDFFVQVVNYNGGILNGDSRRNYTFSNGDLR